MNVILFILTLLFLASSPIKAQRREDDFKRDPYWARGSVEALVFPRQCTDGEPAYFGLQALTSELPTPAEIRFPGGILQSPLRTPNGVENVRLDLCLDSIHGKLYLQQIVYRKKSGEILVAPVRADSVVTGLESAVLGQDTSQLTLILSYKMLAFKDFGFVLHGTQHPRLGPIVSFAFTTNTSHLGEPFFPTATDPLLVGTLTLGSPFRDGICSRSGGRFEIAHYTLGTAEVAVGVCREGAIIGGTQENYSIVSLSVTDDSSYLPELIRGKTQYWQGDDLKKILRSTINHHNDCDSFALTLPHATYAATSRRGSGQCANIAPGAPLRFDSDESMRAIKYEVTYTSGEKVTGYVENCGHITRCNNTDH